LRARIYPRCSRRQSAPGTGLTTLLANAEPSPGIERSLASFARQAAKADECYVFVPGRRAERQRRSASAPSRRRSGCPSRGVQPHVGTQVHASRELGGPPSPRRTLFPHQRSPGPRQLCSLFLDRAVSSREERPAHRQWRGCCSSPSSPTGLARNVIAELRGRLDADGPQPVLGEGLGRHFFAME
jgi:arginine/ornithine N-succinyltransferase beta subunit